ncbi:hypothetical protein LINPERPRIM_LOCUS16862 [Linum perenne]
MSWRTLRLSRWLSPFQPPTIPPSRPSLSELGPSAHSPAFSYLSSTSSSGTGRSHSQSPPSPLRST